MKKQFYLICYSLVQMLLIIGDILLFVFSLLPINSPCHKNPHNCSLGWHWIRDSSTSASRVLQRQANPTMASSTLHSQLPDLKFPVTTIVASAMAPLPWPWPELLLRSLPRGLVIFGGRRRAQGEAQQTSAGVRGCGGSHYQGWLSFTWPSTPASSLYQGHSHQLC